MSVTDRDRGHLSIGEVLSLLQGEFPDVTISKIRFLESQGLIDPERTPSGYRKFYDADIDRLRSILTLQRDHFLPLRVIKERIESVPGLLNPGGPMEGTSEERAPTAGQQVHATSSSTWPEPTTDHLSNATPRPLVLNRPDNGAAEQPDTLPAGAGVLRGGLVGPASAVDRSVPAAIIASDSRVEGERAGELLRAASARPAQRSASGSAHPSSGRVFPWMQRAGATAERTTTADGTVHGLDAAADPAVRIPTGPLENGPAGMVAADFPAGGAPPENDSGATLESAAMVAASRPNPGSGPVAATTGPTGPTEPASPPGTGSGTGENAVDPESGAAPTSPEPPASRPHTPDDAEGSDPTETGGRGNPRPGGRAISGDVSSVRMTTDELSAATGLTAEQLAELERYGLIVGSQSGPVRFFDDDALVVARLAERLAAFGIEPRHLRMYKVAAEREVALYDQVVSPLAHHRDRTERAAQVMGQLVDLGEAMRRALVQRAVHESRRS